MKKMAIAALALLTLAGTSLAAPRETQTFAGPYNVYGVDAAPDPRNTTVTATFTGTGYTVIGLRIQMQLDPVEAATWLSEATLLCTPPSGAPFEVVPAPFDEDAYGPGMHVMFTVTQFPADVNPIGQWQFQLFDSFMDSEVDGPDTSISNLRISLESDETPVVGHDFGTLAGSDQSHAFSDYVGGDVRWLSFTIPSDADDAGGFWVDINTAGSTLAEGFLVGADDTMMGLYRSDGSGVAIDDDSSTGFLSALSFGATASRDHGDGFNYNGIDGALTAGTYYIGVGAFVMDFYNNFFNIDAVSDTPGGTINVNVFNNFPGGPASCSPADVGVAGGEPGQDNLLDNNDFIAFINFFFAQDPAADQGIAGGEAGSDSVWDNNDFIAFINHFFEDTANCTG